jgi:hypothetical protein
MEMPKIPDKFTFDMAYDAIDWIGANSWWLLLVFVAIIGIIMFLSTIKK